MDRGMVIFLGALFTFASRWLGLILFPFWQLRDEQPYQKDAGDESYPRPLQGQAAWPARRCTRPTGACTATASRCGANTSATGGTRTANRGPARTSSAATGCAAPCRLRLPLRQPDDARHLAHRAGPREHRRAELVRGVAPHPPAQPAAPPTRGASCRRSRSDTRARRSSAAGATKRCHSGARGPSIRATGGGPPRRNGTRF